MKATTEKIPTILSDYWLKLNPGAARYWKAKARKLVGIVDIIDPLRRPLKELRQIPHYRGMKVYRASTGGKWGKSHQITTI